MLIFEGDEHVVLCTLFHRTNVTVLKCVFTQVDSRGLSLRLRHRLPLRGRVMLFLLGDKHLRNFMIPFS